MSGVIFLCLLMGPSPGRVSSRSEISFGGVLKGAFAGLSKGALLCLIIGPRPGRISSDSAGVGVFSRGSGGSLEGGARAWAAPLRLVAELFVLRSFCDTDLSRRELASEVWDMEFFLGDIRSALRGGGSTGSFFMGLIKGAGTRSLSANCGGFIRSIGGRFLSGGRSLAGSGGMSPNRPKAPGPAMPPRDRGGKLEESSPRPGLSEAGTES